MDLVQRLRTLTAWKGEPFVCIKAVRMTARASHRVTGDDDYDWPLLEVMLEELLFRFTGFDELDRMRIVSDISRVVMNDLRRGGAPVGTELEVELFLLGPTEVVVGVSHAHVPESPDVEQEDGTAVQVGYGDGLYCLMRFMDGAQG